MRNRECNFLKTIKALRFEFESQALLFFIVFILGAAAAAAAAAADDDDDDVWRLK